MTHHIQLNGYPFKEMKTIYIVLTSSIILLTQPILAQEERNTKLSVPIILSLQFAGNVGLASVGAGTALNQRKIYLGIVYGYLPQFINDVEVHTIAAKAHFSYLKIEIAQNLSTTGYIGTNLNYAIVKNTYLVYPDYYPDGYYNTNALHLAPFIGQKVDFELKNRSLENIGLYFELGTIDSYIANLVTTHQIPVYEIFNLCAGVTITLKTH